MARGWTHEELARRAAVNWRTVQRWQKGNLPRSPTLLRLADILGVPQGHLIESESSIEDLRELKRQVDELAERVEALTRLVSQTRARSSAQASS